MADETLLDGLKKKRRNSIERAIEIYTPYISTVVFNLAGNSLSREDTEEIISDVFISLWENAAYINLQKGTIRSYIAAIARNATLKRLRQKKEFYTCDNFEAVDQDNEFERFEESSRLSSVCKTSANSIKNSFVVILSVFEFFLPIVY